MVSPPPTSPAASILPLERDECLSLLGRQRLCVLSVVDGSIPYAVPLFYGCDGTSVYLGVAEGRKTRILDENPALCLTVTEVGPGDHWATVQVNGRAEWLDGDARAQGVEVLIRHNQHVRNLRPVSSGEAAMPLQAPAGPRRHASGRVLRVAEPVISGRMRG